MPFRREITYNLTGTLDGLTLLDQTVGTEQDNTNLASLQVHAHALDTRGEPEVPLAGYSDAEGHANGRTYSTSSSAWTLAIPWTRAIPSLSKKAQLVHCKRIESECHCVVDVDAVGYIAGKLNFFFFSWARAVTYPTERTRPVSATLASSWTPRILCSRREETSVGEALASAA
jgi:hypothetical protein